jgi:hypothetical protein
METFPLNNLAEKFEFDRLIMVRATRGVPSDEVGNRPKWSVGVIATNEKSDTSVVIIGRHDPPLRSPTYYHR